MAAFRAETISRRSTIALTVIAAVLFARTGEVRGSDKPRSSAGSQSRPASRIEQLAASFANPPDDSRIMMRWWWFGPAVVRSELEREMRAMKDAGIGGFEVQPVYPLALDGARSGIKTLPFLSDEFLSALRFTSEKARELGLRMDLTLGSGWPYGGPSVLISHAAGRLRIERFPLKSPSRRVTLPAMGAGETVIGIFLATVNGGAIAPNSLRRLVRGEDGTVELPSDASGEVQFYIASRTGMQVKRAAVGAEGFVLNHLDAAAVGAYLRDTGDKLMRAFEGRAPFAVFCDSLEVYNSDWTDDFLVEFKKRRGYDLSAYLPALAFDIGPETSAIRRDWGRTLTELLNERFIKPLRDWSRKNRTLLRMQCYGVPAAALSSNSDVDLSEGEGFRWRTLSATRWASSASHLFGRRITSSETWTWLHSPSFRATPLDMKAEADLHFLQGVNQLIGHGWPYSPPSAEYPGWRFYAAGVFNDSNPWWIAMPDLTRYLQRISFMLRQGEPRNDVAIYLPSDDARGRFSSGNVNLIESLREVIGQKIIPTVLDAGYGFDFFDDEALAEAGHVDHGRLMLGAHPYKIVILPNVSCIPEATLRVLGQFARSGGSLLATKRTPSELPDFHPGSRDNQTIAQMARSLFEEHQATARIVDDEETGLERALRESLSADFVLSPATPDIGFVHRATDDAEIYFLANSSAERKLFSATFRVRGMAAEIWDPLTGNIAGAHAQSDTEAGTTLSLDLEPYASRLVVFTRRTQAVSTLSESPTKAASFDLNENWTVRFAHGESRRLSTLRSWTDIEDLRFFSGVATYEKRINVPDELFKPGGKMRISLGDGRPATDADDGRPEGPGMRAKLEGPVREAAVVYVNDRRAGAVWCPPYAVDVTGLLHPGENLVRIAVGNLAVNHMAGGPLPDYRLLNLRYGQRFQAQDMDKIKLEPSGLLGPVRLIAEPATR
ncbi:MAG TPA: glycosyl hydrolase [Blastocatellia bacterium]|nr:glycosyl hydrolase [Blastocatellia bacterium]